MNQYSRVEPQPWDASLVAGEFCGMIIAGGRYQVAQRDGSVSPVEFVIAVPRGRTFRVTVEEVRLSVISGD